MGHMNLQKILLKKLYINQIYKTFNQKKNVKQNHIIKLQLSNSKITRMFCKYEKTMKNLNLISKIKNIIFKKYKL